MILYCPEPSVTTVRTFSISAGLAASTVTPGSTAPVVSLTTPAIEPVDADCPWALPATSRNPVTTTMNGMPEPFIGTSPFRGDDAKPALLYFAVANRVKHE